jgi:hypothetical protein
MAKTKPGTKPRPPKPIDPFDFPFGANVRKPRGGRRKPKGGGS